MVDLDERRLTLLLVGAIIVSTVGIVYFSATPNQRTDPYTEFYIEGEGGNASDYPQDLTVGEAGSLTVGIGNHEHRAMQYTLVMRLDDETIRTQTITVENDETWEGERSFSPSSSGRQRLQLLLYRGDTVPQNAEPYRTVYLWGTVDKA